MRRYFYPK